MSKAERPSEMKRQAGLRLRVARELLGLRQEAMAHVLGCTRTAYTNWENGERLPDIAAMVRLYNLTGITLEWIFAGSVKEIAYDKAAELQRLASELGAVVGGNIAEWPMAVAREPEPHSLRTPASAPPRRPRPRGTLHEDVQ